MVESGPSSVSNGGGGGGAGGYRTTMSLEKVQVVEDHLKAELPVSFWSIIHSNSWCSGGQVDTR